MDNPNEHFNKKPIQNRNKKKNQNVYQPINAGSLNPFHNNIQTFSFNLNDKSLVSLPKLPTFSSSLSSLSPTSEIKKKRKRPKGIPKYKESPTKKRRKYNTLSPQHSVQLSPLFNDNNIPKSIQNVPDLIQCNNNNKNKLSFNLNDKTGNKKRNYNVINTAKKGKILNSLNEGNISLGNGQKTTKKVKINRKYVSSKVNKNSKKHLLKSKSMPELHTKSKKNKKKNVYLTRSKRKKLHLELEKQSTPSSESPSVEIMSNKSKKKNKKSKKKSKKKRNKKSRKKQLKKSKTLSKIKKPKNKNLMDEYLSNICIKEDMGDKIEKEECMKWMSISNKIDLKFDISIRLDKNCISNYALHKNDINMSWINAGENIQKIIFDTSYSDRENIAIPNVRYAAEYAKENDNNSKVENIKYMDYDVNDEYYNSDYIRLHRINLRRDYINLECPNCGIYLQCISLSDSNICFICFNYPRCMYPLNDVEYQSKYIWNNVKYIGPLMNGKCEDELLFYNKNENDNCDMTYKEIYLSSFGEKKNLYIQWSRQQSRLNKKLNNTINWKKLLRNKRYKLLSKQYYKLEKLKYLNIKTNKQFVDYLFKNRKYKINKLRQKNINKFKQIMGNDCNSNVQQYEIKEVINGEKVVLIPYPLKGRNMYRTRSRSKIISKNKKRINKYESFLGVSSDSSNDNESNDPSYIPSPVPVCDTNETKLFDYENNNCLNLIITDESESEFEILPNNKIKIHTPKRKYNRKFDITSADKLTFIDLYKTLKMNVNYSIQWLFEQLKQKFKRYNNLTFESFHKCMKQLLKPNIEKELIENLAMQSMPDLSPHTLPFYENKMQLDNNNNNNSNNKSVMKQLPNELPVFDLKAFANKFKLTQKK